MATIPLTKRGAEKLKDELHQLKSKERHAVIRAISEARAQGDLSENAEYEAARTNRALLRAASSISKASWQPHKSSTRPRWTRAAGWCSAPPSIWKNKPAARP